jgi:hypothetical protein
VTPQQQKTFGILAAKHAGCEITWDHHSQWSDRIFVYVYRGDDKLRYTVCADGSVLRNGKPLIIRGGLDD